MRSCSSIRLSDSNWPTCSGTRSHVGVADTAEHDLRVLHVSLALQQAQQFGQPRCMICGTTPIDPVTSNSTTIGVEFGWSAPSRPRGR